MSAISFSVFWKVEVVEIRRARWDHTHHDSVSAPLLEDVYAKTPFARNAKREVSRTALFQTLNGDLADWPIISLAMLAVCAGVSFSNPGIRTG